MKGVYMKFSKMKEIPDYELKEPFYKENIKWSCRHNWELEDKSKRREHVIIHDVTLRDGDQTPGTAFLEDERVRIADELAEMRMPRIEAGMPSLNNAVEKAMRRITAKKYPYSKIYAFTKPSIPDIELCHDIGCDGVQISHTANPYIIKHIYNDSPKSVVDKLATAINKSIELGMETCFMAWDFFRAPLEFTKPLIEELCELTDLTALALVDSTGCATPDTIEEMFRLFKGWFPKLHLEYHGHNDLGCGTANCLAAVRGGAEVVQTAINGLGAGNGNVPTEEVAVIYEFHKGVDTGLDMTKLAPCCELVSTITRIPIHESKPVMGSRGYKFEVGMVIDITWRLAHLEDGKKITNFIDTVNPELIGMDNKLEFVLGKTSGKKSVELYLEKYNIEATDEEINKILEMVYAEAMVTRSLVSDRKFLQFVNKVKKQLDKNN
jgi:isopropylmalate/homocitrate/citramalate synthase